MSLYDALAKSPDGQRRLAAARLRHQTLRSLHRALKASGLNQVELAERLGVRKSAVNQILRGDGNLRVSTFAEYLDAMGFEADVALVPAGQIRARIEANRHADRNSMARVIHLPPNSGSPSESELFRANEQKRSYRTTAAATP